MTRRRGSTRVPFSVARWLFWAQDRGWIETPESRRQRLRRRAGIAALRQRLGGPPS